MGIEKSNMSGPVPAIEEKQIKKAGTHSKESLKKFLRKSSAKLGLLLSGLTVAQHVDAQTIRRPKAHVDTVYVTDKNDPRLKAYEDSMYAYTKGQEYIQDVKKVQAEMNKLGQEAVPNKEKILTVVNTFLHKQKPEEDPRIIQAGYTPNQTLYTALGYGIEGERTHKYNVTAGLYKKPDQSVRYVTNEDKLGKNNIPAHHIGHGDFTVVEVNADEEHTIYHFDTKQAADSFVIKKQTKR